MEIDLFRRHFPVVGGNNIRTRLICQALDSEAAEQEQPRRNHLAPVFLAVKLPPTTTMFARRPTALSAPVVSSGDIKEITERIRGLSIRSPRLRVVSREPVANSSIPRHGYYLGEDYIFPDTDSLPGASPSNLKSRSPMKPALLAIPVPVVSNPPPLKPVADRSKAPTRRVSEPLPQHVLVSSEGMAPSNRH